MIIELQYFGLFNPEIKFVVNKTYISVDNSLISILNRYKIEQDDID